MIFLFLVALAVVITIVYSLRYGISPMPSSPKVKRALLKNLPNKITGTVYELGAGWGTLAFPLARKYPDATIYAYEISPIPFLFMKLRELWDPLPNLIIYRKDFFDEKIKDDALIVCYLYPGAMRRLKVKGRIVTHTFSLPGVKAEKVIHVNDLYKTAIFFYF